MGYGVPAGVAAKLIDPSRAVVVLAGDGDFLMTGQELATATQEGAALLFVVVDNGMYGTIRMHQQRDYPGRVSGTAAREPRLRGARRRATARSASSSRRTDAFAPALDRALALDRRPNAGRALIALKADPRIITPSMLLPD